MRRNCARLLVVLMPLLSLTLAPAPAQADPVDDAMALLSLRTTAYFSGTSLTFVAEGEFIGGVIANSVVALQAVGTETWTDSRGVTRVTPLACHGESVKFDSRNVVMCTVALVEPDSVVASEWTAEAFGLAPTVFAGTCAGTAARDSGGTVLVIPTC